MLGGDPEWAREIRRQLILEIDLVGGGMAEGGRLLHQDTQGEAEDRIADLRRRLEQVDRLIEAIEALRDDERENGADASGNGPNNGEDGELLDNASMTGRHGRGSGSGSSLTD